MQSDLNDPVSKQNIAPGRCTNTAVNDLKFDINMFLMKEVASRLKISEGDIEKHYDFYPFLKL